MVFAGENRTVVAPHNYRLKLTARRASLERPQLSRHVRQVGSEMNNEQPSHPTTRYIRTVFHLGLFGLLSLLFAQVYQSKGTLNLALRIIMAAILPYYPAIWVSRIKSRAVLITLLLVIIVAIIYLLYVEINKSM